MKFKVKKDKASGGRLLTFESDRGDELDYVDAERLQRGDLDPFLPFEYEKGKKCYRVTYRLGSCVSLKAMLDLPFAPMQLRALLTSLLHTVRVCEENKLSRLHIVFEPDNVFYDPNGRSLQFAYVPLRLYSSSVGEVSMLARICETAVLPPSDQQLGMAVLDYARRTTVLTSVAFEEFLRSQGLYAAGDEAGYGDFAVAHTTDALDTRTSHGWNFVLSAQQAQRAEEMPRGHRFLLVRMSEKTSYQLADGAYTLGRGEACAISVAGAQGISREHARLVVRGDQCTIADLHSTNGVFVNGSRVQPDLPQVLHPGDRFTLAREEFELL